MSRTQPVTWAKVMAGTAVLALSLAACGSNDSSTPSAQDTNEPSETTSPTESESSAPANFTNDKCKSNQTSANAYRVGGLLPLTGNLAFLGPPEIAALGLAVSDINAAGGVNGNPACYEIQDSGASSDMSVSSASAQTLIANKPSVVIGASSSSVSLNVVDTFAESKIVEISPANTSVLMSAVSPWYFRTAPPDTVQGDVLGTLISSDGYQKIGFLVFNDTYGTGLRDIVQSTFEGAGAQCVYGCKGDGDEFPADQTTFSTEVGAVLAANPDAIVILAFDETKAIVPELKNQGWDMSKVYTSDGNTSDYSKDFPAGTMEGAQGTIPGADPTPEFKALLNSWYDSAQGASLTDYAYAAESYDATMLAALAAVKGGSTESAVIQKNLSAVSGATGGEKCTTYADCVALLGDGKEIRYTGPSGIGPLNKDNDPSSGFIGIYDFDADNKPMFTTTVEASVK